ncbi:MAG: fibronectin type III domain-containing protein [Bacteroidia bacterium]
MKKSKIITGFTKFTDPELDVVGQRIVTKMTGNPNFATPTPTLKEVDDAKTAYETALTTAANGNTNDTDIKNKKRSVLEDLLHRLGLYVELTANGDEAILFSSGFDLQKEKAAVGVLPKPENLKVSMGANPGTIKLVVNSIANANSYVFEYTLAPVTNDSKWIILPISKANIEITGLVSGQQYAFKVSGVGTNPTLVFSDIVTSFVL